MKRKKNQAVSHRRFFLLLGIFVLVNLILGVVWLSVGNQPASSGQNTRSAGNIMRDANYFTGKSATFEEIASFYRTISLKYGAAYGFTVLKQSVLPPNTDYHLVAHVVGDVLFKQQDIQGIKICTDDFRNACSHSIVVGALLKNGVNVLPKLAAICHQAPGGRGAYTMCFHGLGHGVLAFVDYNMPKAVGICQKLGTAAYWNREGVECVGGTTMEMMSGVHDIKAWLAAKKHYLSPSDPLAPCDSDFVPAEDKDICYTYLTPHLFEAAGTQLGNPNPAFFNKAFHLCDAIPNEGNRQMCYGGFGKEFIGLVNARDVRNLGLLSFSQLQTIASWCNLAETQNAVQGCVTATEASLYWGGEALPDAAITFCSVVSDPMKAPCYNELIGAIQYYKGNTPEAQQTCQRLPDSYKAQCTTT